MNPENYKIHSQAGDIELTVVQGISGPRCLDAERLLLACILLDDTGSAWAIAQNCGVKKKAFAERGAGVIFGLVSELRQRGEASVDAAMILEELNSRGELELVGGVPGFSELTAAVGSTMNVRFYAETVVLVWQRRHALVVADKLREAAVNFKDRASFTATASEMGQKLIGLGRMQTTRSLPEVYNAVGDEARARAEGTVDRSKWVPSGVSKFDKQLRRFGSAAEDHFIVVGGGSGDGKSVILRQIALASLEEKKRVLSYSRETSTAGFIEMLIASKTGLDLNHLEYQPLPDMERFYAECRRQRDEWADRFLFCVQHEPATSLLTIEDLCENARAFVHLHGPPHVILVDYLQIFSTRKRMPSREAEVGFMSHTLQSLQREIGCVVVVAVQLNESGLSEQRKATYDDKGHLVHRLPRAGDLRESQAIYHDADRVVFIYRPPVDSVGRDQSNFATAKPEQWLCQVKRRRGGTGYVRCWFEKKYTRFVALTDEDLTQANTAAAASGTLPKGTLVPKSQFMGGESP